MSITKKEHPQNLNGLWAANNLIPTILDSNNKNSELFEYILDLCYLEWVLSSNSISIVTFNGYSRPQINGSTDHSFKIGDFVFIENANAEYNGLHKVLDIPDSQTIIIDLRTTNTYDQSFSVWKGYRLKANPRPKDGYGVYDVSPIVQSFVGNTFDPDLTGVTKNDTLVADIQQFHHELYVQTWDFIDNYYSNGNAGFRGSTQPPFESGDRIIVNQTTDLWTSDVNRLINVGFSDYGLIVLDGDKSNLYDVGDQIDIRNASNSSNDGQYTIDGVFYQNSGNETYIYINSDLTDEDPSPAEASFENVGNYEGRHTVVQVYQNNNNDWIVESNTPWAYNTPPISGTVSNSRSDLSVQLNAGTFDSYSVFDGALLFNDRRDWDGSQWTVIGGAAGGGNEDNFLASHNIPNSEKLLSDSYLDINFFATDSSVVESYDRIRLQTNNKNSTDGDYVIDIDTSGLGSNHKQAWSFHCGPAQLDRIPNSEITVSGGTLPIIQDDTVEYTFWVETTSTARASEKWNVKIFDAEHWNDECTPYTFRRLLFKDRFGSYQGFLLKRLTKGEIDYTRDNFRDGSLKVNNDSVDNRSHIRGLTNLYNDQEQIYILTSGFIDETEFEWLKEALDSSEIYLENDVYDELVPVVIDTDTVEIIRDDRRELQEVEMEVRVSNRQVRQRF